MHIIKSNSMQKASALGLVYLGTRDKDRNDFIDPSTCLHVGYQNVGGFSFSEFRGATLTLLCTFQASIPLRNTATF